MLVQDLCVLVCVFHEVCMKVQLNLLLCQILLDYSNYLDQLRNPYLHHHHRRRLQTTKEEEEEDEETESGVASGDSQTALT